MESSTMLMQNISSESMSDSEDGDSLGYHPEQKLDGSNSPTDVRSYRHTHNNDGNGSGNGNFSDDDGLDLNRSLARLGDLPIVREGSILNEDEDNDILMHGSHHTDDHYNTYTHNHHRENHHDEVDDDDDDEDDEEEMHHQFMEYEREQEELHREMNLNKIAFAAYRSAVLHLVHNQASFTKKKENDDTDDDDNDNDNDDDDQENDTVSEYDESIHASKSLDDDILTVDTQEDANLRMTVIEETAKEIVETKAKACFDAVAVAHEFGKLREERRLRQRMLLGGLAGVGGEDNILEEFRKMRKFGKGVRAKRAEKVTMNEDVGVGVNVDVDVDVDVPKESSPTPATKTIVSKPKVAVVTKKSIQPKPIKKKNTTSLSSSSPSNTEFKLSLAGPILPPIVGPIVRMKKKPSRHVDCIKHTLPKFQPKKTNNTKENNGPAHTNDNNDPLSSSSSSSSSTPGYRTTKWIREISKWRIDKNDHEEARLKKCGCPDCLVELKCMYDKKKVFSMTQ